MEMAERDNAETPLFTEATGKNEFIFIPEYAKSGTKARIQGKNWFRFRNWNQQYEGGISFSFSA